MGRFLICAGKATDFGNVHRNVNKLGVPATSGGRAFRTFAIAPYRLRGTPSAVLQSLTHLLYYLPIS